MKKFLSFLLLITLLFSAVACNNDDSNNVTTIDGDDTKVIECEHDWADATCTAPKTCNLCGETEGDALTHIWTDDWTITSVPYQNDAWKKTQFCTLCGAEDTIAFPSELTIPSTPTAPIYAPNTDTSGQQKVKLVSGGKAQFTIVSADPAYDSLASDLATKLREKFGVTFNYKPSSQQSSVSGKKIVIGNDPTKIQGTSELSYLGILFAYTGTSIHITGYLNETVKEAVNQFIAMDFSPYISTGTDGKKLVSVPSGMLTFIGNPTNYLNPNPTLFGTPLSEYTIVLPQTMSGADNLLLVKLIDEMGRYCGVYFSTKTEDKATGVNEIVIGNTSLAMSQSLYATLGENTYAMKDENGCLYITYGDYVIEQEARKALEMLLLSNVSESVNVSTLVSVRTDMRIEKTEDTDIRVMTSNIVCAADANGIKEIEKPYGITWQERIAIVTREIMIYLPDSIGFQEIQNGTVNSIPADMFTEILNNLSSEYEFVTYEGMDPIAYWNPIMYRKTAWQVEAKDVLYPENFDNAMHRWQWVLFSKIDDPTQKYIHLNLHNPTRSGNLPGQLAAADIVNAKIRELKELYPGVPIILTGDFNTELDTETYQRTIANTDVRCSYILTDDCNDLGDLTGTETPTSKDDVIDHVMVSTDLLEVIACRKVDGEYMLLTSDHRPMFVDLAFKN